MRKRVELWLGRLNYKYLGISLLLLIGIFVVYFWHLSSLTTGLSPAENTARASSTSLHKIIDNPVNAPQRLLQYAAQKVGYHGAFSMRLASVIIAIMFIVCVFWLMKTWFGLTIGVFSTLMFAATPIVILLARSATSNIMLLMPAAVLVAYVWLSRRKHKPDRAWLSLVIISTLSLYTPGMIWLVLIGLAVLHTRVIVIVKSINQRLLAISAAVFVLLSAPLIYALVKDISLFHEFLLLPSHWLGLEGTAKSIIWSGLALVWRAREHSDLIINRLPLLDIIQISLIVFGAYVMWSRARREVSALLALIVLAVVLAGINANILLLTICLPSLAILAGAGLRYLYIEWRGIFPKNPLPLSLALVVIASLVGLQVAYGLRYSLVAWPHTPATKQLYVIK